MPDPFPGKSVYFHNTTPKLNEHFFNIHNSGDMTPEQPSERKEKGNEAPLAQGPVKGSAIQQGSVNLNTSLYRKKTLGIRAKNHQKDLPLSREELQAMRKERDKAVSRRGIVSSLLTLPITAFTYWQFGDPEKANSFLKTAALISPTIALWYGSYFGQVNAWKKKMISKNPKWEKLFTKKKASSYLKIFVAGEASWYVNRHIGDTLAISALGLLFGASKLTIAAGALASHSVLAFIVYPKLVLPLFHRLFDEEKKPQNDLSE